MKDGWKIETLEEVSDINFGTRVVRSKDGGFLYPVYGGGGATFKMDIYNRENALVVSRFAMSKQCTRFVEGKFFLNDSGLSLEAKPEKLNQDFLKYQIFCLNDIIYKCSSGSAQKNLKVKEFAKLPIAYPSLSEQTRIVSLLDDAFGKLERSREKALKLLDDAKEIFQAQLKKEMTPKKGWEVKKLGEVAADVRYGTSSPSHENGDYKYLRMNNITNDGFLDISHFKTISLSEKELEKCLVRKGDIIFNRTNSLELVGKSCVFTSDEDMVIAGYLIRIRLNNGFEPQFITYNMNMQRSMGNFNPFISGAVHQANISAKNIQKLDICFPPLSEQSSIVSRLDVLSSQLKQIEEKTNKYLADLDELKQSLLKKAFEGKL